MKIKVRVTQDHIDRGVANDPNRCPVALALEDATVHHDRGYSSVGGNIYVKPGHGKTLKAATPERAMLFIQDFDAGKSVSPLSFTLTLKPMERLSFSSRM